MEAKGEGVLFGAVLWAYSSSVNRQWVVSYMRSLGSGWPLIKQKSSAGVRGWNQGAVFLTRASRYIYVLDTIPGTLNKVFHLYQLDFKVVTKNKELHRAVYSGNYNQKYACKPVVFLNL